MIKSSKPKDIVEYKQWLKNTFNIEISEKNKRHYDSVVYKIKKDFDISPFWKELKEKMKEIEFEYDKKTNYPLFLNSDFKPRLETKPYTSFLGKTFRKNIIDNKNWPNEPSDGWITPDNWFEKIDDILRTSFTVKFLDGVAFLVKEIEKIGNNYSLNFKKVYKAKEEGYYAVHLYSKTEIEVPEVDIGTKIIKLNFEFQVTTQLQELIRNLLHKIYEEERTKTKKLIKNWQWNYRTIYFKMNYLGHILHYLEGMITEIKNKKIKR